MWRRHALVLFGPFGGFTRENDGGYRLHREARGEQVPLVRRGLRPRLRPLRHRPARPPGRSSVPWHRPIPARVARLSTPASPSPSSAKPRIVPAVTPSHRQSTVSAVVRRSGGAANRGRHSALWNARPRASARRAPPPRRLASSAPRYPETARGLQSGEHALREGDPRPADAAAVARHQHPGTRRGAVLAAPRREAGERARPVVVAAAEESGQLARGREAVAEADRVDLPGSLRARHGPAGAVDAREDRALRRPRALDPHQGMSERAASRRDAQAPAGSAVRRGRGRVRARGRGSAAPARAGPGRGAASATATTSTPLRTQLAGDLEVERAVAGNEDPRARRHSVRAHQRLRGTGGHHPGQRPSRHRCGRSRRHRSR